MEKPAMEQDRREFERQKGCLTAQAEIAFRPPVSCIVEDISVAGARIVPSEPIWFPRVFQLVITAGNFKTYCEVRHRYPNGVGVAFVDAPHVGDIVGWTPDDADSDTPDVTQVLAALS